MTIIRHYIMTAKAGSEEALQTALLDLIPQVQPLPGCEGLELLRDQGNPRRFFFLEKWADADAHKAGAAALPKEAFGPMMAAIDGAPDGAYLDYINAA